MDFKIKTEHDIEELNFFHETLQCCLLCPDVKKCLYSLISHIKKFHREDFREDVTLKLNLCTCHEVVKLQVELITHLLAQIIHTTEQKDQIEVPLIPENILPDEEIKVETSDENRSESDEEEQFKRKYRRKKKTVNRSTHLAYPVRTEHLPEPQFPCEYCTKKMYTKSGLSKHYNMMHDPANKFKCTKCNTGHCNTLKNLHAHMRTHESVKLDTKICPKCNKKYQTEKQLYHHMLLHREKLLICDHCDMRFNMKQPLQKHIFTHFDIKIPRENESKSLCEICSKWVTSSRMKRHLGTHFSSECKANFKCDFDGCGKAFTEQRNLLDHQNVHMNLKPYVCEFCNMMFRHRAALRQHRMRHTEPEKHKCEVCQECFVTNQSLRKHMQRQHRDNNKDVRPYACDFEGCSSTFKYEDFLIRHKKDVHNPKPNIEKKCEYCNYVAHNTKNYFQHMRRSHDIRKRVQNRVFPTAPSTNWKNN